MHIFIWGIIIALTYIALNTNAVRPDVRVLSKMGQQSIRGSQMPDFGERDCSQSDPGSDIS